MIRVSDEEETRVSLALSGPRGLARRALRGATCGLRRRAGGCLMIVGFEGDEESVARRRALAVRELRAGGAAYLGQAAGRSWEHGRYQGPYLRDTLMEMGAMVETLETSHTWSRLGELHAAVGDAIRGRARRPGHARDSSSATSPTPTPTAPRSTSPSSPGARPGAEIEQWRAVKTAACEAIVAARRRRSPTTTRSAATTPPTWRRRWASSASRRCARVKERLDPAGIMNPGKLLG